MRQEPLLELVDPKDPLLELEDPQDPLLKLLDPDSTWTCCCVKPEIEEWAVIILIALVPQNHFIYQCCPRIRH